MHKVIYGGGLFSYNDIKDLPFPEKHVQLVKIEAPDEKEAREKYIAERVKNGTLHPYFFFTAK